MGGGGVVKLFVNVCSQNFPILYIVGGGGGCWRSPEVWALDHPCKEASKQNMTLSPKSLSQNIRKPCIIEYEYMCFLSLKLNY